jgi:hypothetical protein
MLRMMVHRDYSLPVLLDRHHSTAQMQAACGCGGQ